MDLTNIIRVGNEFLNSTQQIGDSGIDRDRIKGQEISREFSEDYGKFKLSGAGKAAYGLSIFNDDKDLDNSDGDKEDSVIKQAVSKVFYDQYALLRHTGEFNGELGLNMPLGNLTLGANGALNLKFRAYRIHDRHTPLAQAWLRDAADFKLILKAEHIRDLAVSEALTMDVLGSIEVAGTFEWSDMITGSVSALSELSKLSGALAFKVSSGASVSFTCKLEDNFQVSIQKTTTNDYLLKINKKSKRDSDLNLTAEVGVEFTDRQNVNSLIDELVATAEEKTLSKIREYVKNPSGDTTQMIAYASEALGWDIPADAPNLPEVLTNWYDEFSNNLKIKIKDIAEKKIKLAAGFAYRRISSRESLFEAILPYERVATHHERILNLEIEPLLSDASGEIKVKKYFQKNTLETSTAFNLGVSLGSFGLLSKTTKEFAETQEFLLENEDKKYKVSVLGAKKTNELKEGKNSYKYLLSMDADMPDYVTSADLITTEKFHYGLHLGWQWEEKKTTSEELAYLVDWAALWDIIGQSEFEGWHQKLHSIIVGPKTKAVQYESYIKVPEGVLNDLLEKLACLTNDDWASAMAASVPYQPWVGRNRAADRRLLYFNIWKTYLTEHSALAGHGKLEERTYNKLFQDFVYSDLKKINSRAADFDGTANESSYCLTSLLSKNIIIQQVQPGINAGFKSLFDPFKNKTHYQHVLRRAFKKIDDIQLQRSFNIRFFGRLLLDVANASGVGHKIEKAMAIKYNSNNKEETIVFSKG